MPLKIYNTITGNKELFKPIKPPMVGLYTCGPTVYHYAHIGNLRAFIFEDVLKRALLFNGFKVNHIMNITDVGHLTSDADEGEDKMAKGLKREGLPLTIAGMKQLAGKYAKAFVNDLKKLHLLLPTAMPKASSHIPEDISLIKILEKKGFTYNTSDGIYFDTSKLKDYGKLAKRGDEQKEDGESHHRIKAGEKKNHQDFALWKFNGQLGWDSPYGKGFPGWHIECSAMASKYLGKQFDIHCGGKEHIPIHHTNEIAQSEAAWGKKPWVRYWLHNEWLILANQEKMAKSGENFITLQTLEENSFEPLDLRYLCLGTSYRNPLMFSYQALEGARTARKKLFEAVIALRDSNREENKLKQKKYLNRFISEINDDLNTPKALAVLWEVIKTTELSGKDKYLLLLQFDKVLGFNLGNLRKEKIPSAVIQLAEQREAARKDKDWNAADKLRQQIQDLGYVIEDGPEEFMLRKN